jgi:sugar-specific transcriptional regulator TrmB
MNFGAPLQVRQALRMLGFSENEVRILLVLFKEKKASTVEISKQAALSFSTAQYLLKNLVNRKIVRASGTEEDTFETLPEKELSDWIDEHKKINESLYEGAKSDLNNFLTNIKDESWRPEVLYFEGEEGVRQIYEDVLSTGEDIYSWVDIDKLRPVIGDYLEEYIKQRKKRGITSHSIMPKSKSNVEREHEKENREARIVKRMDIDGEIRIYGDKVAVITFDGKRPVGFVFRGEVITRLFKAIHDTMWKTEEK